MGGGGTTLKKGFTLTLNHITSIAPASFDIRAERGFVLSMLKLIYSIVQLDPDPCFVPRADTANYNIEGSAARAPAHAHSYLPSFYSQYPLRFSKGTRASTSFQWKLFQVRARLCVK